MLCWRLDGRCEEVYLGAVASAEFSVDELYEGVGAECVWDSCLNPKPPVLTVEVAVLCIREETGVYPGTGAGVAELEAIDAGATSGTVGVLGLAF